MVIPGHQQQGAVLTGEIPQPGQRPLGGIGHYQGVAEQAKLNIRLGNAIESPIAQIVPELARTLISMNICEARKATATSNGSTAACRKKKSERPNIAARQKRVHARYY